MLTMLSHGRAGIPSPGHAITALEVTYLLQGSPYFSVKCPTVPGLKAYNAKVRMCPRKREPGPPVLLPAVPRDRAAGVL